MSRNRIPLVETSVFRRIAPPILVESKVAGSPSSKVVIAKGVFQNWLDENENKRKYPKEIWERHFASDSSFMQKIKDRGVLGVLEHPGDGITNIRSVSHVVTEVHMTTPDEIAEFNSKLIAGQMPLREGDIIGTYECLPAPTDGALLAALLEANIQFGVSSRGSGSVTEDANGSFIVDADAFELETWDVVCNPSVVRAIPKALRENCDKSHKDSKFQISIAFDEDRFKKVRTYNILEAATEADARLQAMKLFEAERKAAIVEAVSVSAPPAPAPAAPPAPAPAAPPAPVQESKPVKSTPMSKLHEFNRLRNQLNTALLTEAKLKPSARASLIQTLEEGQVEIARLVQEDPTLKGLADTLNERVSKFITHLDEEEVPGGPPAGGPPAGGPPPPPAAGPEGEEHGEEEGNEEVHELLTAAAEKLETGCPDDEEACELADQLRNVADAVSVDVPEDLDLDDEGEDFEELPESTKRKLGRVCAQFRILERQHKDLTEASRKLLERHRSLKKDRKAMGESRMIDGKRVTFDEALTAAREIAEDRNKGHIKLGIALTKVTKPEIWAEHKAELSKITIWEKFEKRVIQLVAEKKKKGKKDEKGKKGKFGKRHESQDRPSRAPLNEDLPMAVRIANRARKGGALNG